RIFYCLSRPAEAAVMLNTGSTAIQQSIKLAENGSIIQSVACVADLADLDLRIGQSDNPYHIFHFDGPVVIEDNQAVFILQGNEEQAYRVDAVSLFKYLQEHNIHVVCIQAAYYC